MNVFKSADILLPEVKNMEKWAVIACDQFTSQPEYWLETRRIAGDEPSSVNIILPEAELGADNADKVSDINSTMQRYLADGIFKVNKSSFIFVERTLTDGQLRTGVVGAVDLDEYDYSPDAQTAVRATERTVTERIPPRQAIRRGASLELPHILLLCDDPEDKLMSVPISLKNQLPVVYDFDLMQNGGHITGRLMSGRAAEAFSAALDEYASECAERYSGCAGDALLFAVGDGNHSLATAKACWEEIKLNLDEGQKMTHPARYALVELGNIHEASLQFEAIHRTVSNVETSELLAAMKRDICASDGFKIEWFAGEESGTIYLDRAKGALPVGILQSWLDDALPKFGGEIDYIHGADTAEKLAKRSNTISFVLPPMGKSELFPGIMKGGVLPRKTFSMGHANEKRYYLEARKIVL